MKYTITQQISILPLNHDMQQCKNNETAEYQLEIYTARETQHNIGILEPFNNNKFSHDLNSHVHCVPKTICNGVILTVKSNFGKKQR